MVIWDDGWGVEEGSGATDCSGVACVGRGSALRCGVGGAGEPANFGFISLSSTILESSKKRHYFFALPSILSRSLE